MSLRMLPTVEQGARGPLIVALHWLGGSARTWNEVATSLAVRGYRFVAIDLPGFGSATDATEFSITAMVAYVIAIVRELRRDYTGAWLLAGHSMGGKLAAIIARAAQDGTEGLEELAGILLISPSPAGPEPMKESKRADMLKSLGKATTDATENDTRANKFVQDNVGKLTLVKSVLRRSVDDVLRMNRTAFIEWLSVGSKEDWADQVGFIEVPTLVLAGSEEKALGSRVQRTRTLPHFTNVSLIPLQGCGHLAPLERPVEVAAHVMEFLQRIEMWAIPHLAQVGTGFRELIDSDATSPQTRRVMEERLMPSICSFNIFTKAEVLVLQTLVELVIPDASFDLCARVQDVLSQTRQNGWRFDELPNDVEAWSRGLTSLDAAALREFEVPFIALDTNRQNELLQLAKDGELGKGFMASIGFGESSNCLNGQQMQHWFEDVRAELVRIYVADPRTMERIGFTGFADEKGFTRIRLGEREGFEL